MKFQMYIVDIYDITGWWTLAIGLQICVLATLFLWNKSRTRRVRNDLPNFAQKFAEWNPRPLVEEDVKIGDPPSVGKIGENCLNVGTTNFLAFDKEVKIKEEAIKSVRKYGVGSCGPRGFYGTIDCHLELEERLANFMKVEEMCVYSYGFSTVASAIPAYAKRGDIIFADIGVSFPIQKGIEAARCTVQYFKHNDMSDLEQLLETAVRKQQLRSSRRAFLIAEAIYFNTGEMCPVPRLVKLARKYKLRIILDESLTIGVIGKTGRGITEYLDVAIEEIDLIVGSLEHAFGSVGGFSGGSHFIAEHQRLSGLGYCFSASLPPLLTQAAIAGLDILEKKPSILSELEVNSKKLQSALNQLKNFKVRGHEISPVKHLYIEGVGLTDRLKETYLQNIAKYSLDKGVQFAVAAYLRDNEIECPEPSIRLTSNKNLTDSDIQKVCSLLEEAYETAGPQADIKLK